LPDGHFDVKILNVKFMKNKAQCKIER
jgi:hypothetical protein